MAVFAEIRLEKRTQHLCGGLLDHAIQHRRDSQRAYIPIGLRTALGRDSGFTECEAIPQIRHKRIIHTRLTDAGR